MTKTVSVGKFHDGKICMTCNPACDGTILIEAVLLEVIRQESVVIVADLEATYDRGAKMWHLTPASETKLTKAIQTKVTPKHPK